MCVIPANAIISREQLCTLTGSPVNPILPSIPGFPGGPGSSSGIFPGANNVVRLQLHMPGGPLGPDTPVLTS